MWDLAFMVKAAVELLLLFVFYISKQNKLFEL